MSTKKIREALGMVDTDHPNMTAEQRATVVQALAEVEAIEQAARDIEAWQTAERAVTRETVTAAFDRLSSIAKAKNT